MSLAALSRSTLREFFSPVSGRDFTLYRFKLYEGLVGRSREYIPQALDFLTAIFLREWTTSGAVIVVALCQA